MSNLSPSTLALLRAAKNDAPSKESRQAIWGGVTAGLVTHTPLHITPQGSGLGASAAPPAVAAAAAPAVATKGLATAAGLTGMKGAFIGALFGSAISIGVATFMLRTKPADVPHVPSSSQATTQIGDGAKSNGASTTSSTNAKSAATDPNAASPTSADAPVIELGASNAVVAGKSQSTVNSAGSDVHSSKASSSSNAKSMNDDAQSLHSKKSSTSGDQNVAADENTFPREASLVSEAKRDLGAGDAAAALKAVRAARSLEARQLEPEEMKIEAKALRALGRDTDAEKVEAQRRTMYPNTL